MRYIVVFILLFMCLKSIVVAQGASVDNKKEQKERAEVLRLQELFQEIKTLEFSFYETQYDKDDVLIAQSKGTGLFQKPNLMRWETLEPFSQLLVSDGKTIWFYDPDLLQATNRNLDSSISSSPALIFGGDVVGLDKEFIISERLGEQGVVIYRLQSRSKDNLFDSVEIEFRKKLPIKLSFWGVHGYRTSFHFTEIKKNVSLQDDKKDLFHFEPPAGTDVISELEVER